MEGNIERSNYMLKTDHISLFKIKNNNSHSVGREVFTPAVMTGSIFRDSTSCSPLEVNSRFEGALLAPCYTTVSCLVYSSALVKEATSSSETFVDFLRNTRRYTPENRPLTKSH